MVTNCICGAQLPDGKMRCENCQQDYDSLPADVRLVYDDFLNGVLPVEYGDQYGDDFEPKQGSHRRQAFGRQRGKVWRPGRSG